MVDAEVQTEPSLPATVIGVEKDALIGARVRKSFGSRVFWGSVVGCYWISGGLFYKVSFDDGDVDIFSLDEVLQDAVVAKQHANENPQAPEKRISANELAVDEYFVAMRDHNLKRKRDDVVLPTAFRTRRVCLWGQRLYASILTNMRNETFIRKMLKTEDGKMGEIEASGQVEVGDIILAVNETRVLGMTGKQVAELIRKPKRPLTLTLYRPQHSKSSTLQQNAQSNQDLAALSAPTSTSPQTLQSQQGSTQALLIPSTQRAATTYHQQNAASSSLVPSSFAISPFAPPSSKGQDVADQRIQQASTSQPQTLSTKEIVRQRLSQNAAARSIGYMPRHPAGTFARGNADSASGASFVRYQPQQIQAMQGVVNAANMRVVSGPSAPTAQPARPMPLGSRGQFEHNQEPDQRRHFGSLAHEQVRQMQAMPGSSGHEQRRSSASAEATARSNGTPAVSQAKSAQRVASLQPERVQQEASNRWQTTNHELTNNRDSAQSIPRKDLTSTGSLALPTPAVGTKMLTSLDAEAIARLADENPRAAEHVMNNSTYVPSLSPPIRSGEGKTENTTSFLSPSVPADKDQGTIKRKTKSTSNSMSFLSPNDFNVESSTLSHQDPSAGITANNSAAVKSNVGLVTVTVSRRRLYLTLGVQGTLIAVTSFVPDEFGRPGEVEASGKVLLGDVLVRINETLVAPGVTPTYVADIVNRAPRPITLWFERASWDILDGKA